MACPPCAGQVVSGQVRHCGVPMDSPAIGMFRVQIGWLRHPRAGAAQSHRARLLGAAQINEELAEELKRRPCVTSASVALLENGLPFIEADEMDPP
jgi:hypothetical protein